MGMRFLSSLGLADLPAGVLFCSSSHPSKPLSIKQLWLFADLSTFGPLLFSFLSRLNRSNLFYGRSKTENAWNL